MRLTCDIPADPAERRALWRAWRNDPPAVADPLAAFRAAVRRELASGLLTGGARRRVFRLARELGVEPFAAHLALAVELRAAECVERRPARPSFVWRGVAVALGIEGALVALAAALLV